MDTELSEKAVDVRFDSALSNEELASDLGVWEAFAHERVDLSFARGQGRDRVDDRRSRQAQGRQKFIISSSSDEKERFVAQLARREQDAEETWIGPVGGNHQIGSSQVERATQE